MINRSRDMSAELRTARRKARRDFSASFMSNTKWRTFFSTLQGADPPIRQLVVKLICNDGPQRTGLAALYPPHPFASFFELGGPVPLIELEWVEIPGTAIFQRPDNLPAERLMQDVAAIGRALERTGKLYRIVRTETGLRLFGHLR